VTDTRFDHALGTLLYLGLRNLSFLGGARNISCYIGKTYTTEGFFFKKDLIQEWPDHYCVVNFGEGRGPTEGGIVRTLISSVITVANRPRFGQYLPARIILLLQEQLRFQLDRNQLNR
jgi:hypothetical protein